ncbi:hypothetical protein RCS94_00135 [Orbaceae bacterium ac157xtp]
MRSIRKSHVPTVSFRFERQIAEEGSREATRATAPRRGLRVAALGNPYRSVMRFTRRTRHSNRPKPLHSLNPLHNRKCQQATAHKDS